MSPSAGVILACRLLLAHMIVFVLRLAPVIAAKIDEPPRGYAYGQRVPISCLSRSIELGEHITDQAGNLQYAPFPTCNETSAPLSFRYGVSETVTCTVDPLTDGLYHLLEYYIHADVPLTCRMPTLPLIDSDGASRQVEFAATAGEQGITGFGSGAASLFTPLSIALQGTLQLSHLHIWTDMNVLLHWVRGQGISQQRTQGSKRKQETKQKNKGKRKNSADIRRQRGQIVAGTAYSIPGVDDDDDGDEDTRERSVLDPWAAGGGAKVIRGEPLSFTFRIAWVHGEDMLAAAEPPTTISVGSIFSKLFMYLMAGGIGAVVALWVERRYGRRRGSGWNGDWLLGHSSTGRITIGNPKGYGLGVKMNGYGGYSPGSGPNYGYGGYTNGKRD